MFHVTKAEKLINDGLIGTVKQTIEQVHRQVIMKDLNGFMKEIVMVELLQI